MRPLSWAGNLAAQELQIERKRFFATLKENSSGRFLRLTEVAGDKSNTIIIPASGLRNFSKLLGEMMMAAEGMPPKQSASKTPNESEGGPSGEVPMAATDAVSPAQ